MKHILELGDGALTFQFGIYILENYEQHQIGDTFQVEEDFTIKGKPIMITFSKVESIDVVINDLLDIKQMMIDGVSEDARVLDTHISDFWAKCCDADSNA